MANREEVSRLFDEATASIKSDVKGAVAKLTRAYEIASTLGDPVDTAVVAEELARGWIRRKSPARALLFAVRATKLAPERKAAWNTLAKTCELVASRTQGDHKQARARALYRAAGSAFGKAAALTKDPEDKRWLLELAADASRQAKAPRA
jgi:hypothetical protein